MEVRERKFEHPPELTLETGEGLLAPSTRHIHPSLPMSQLSSAMKGTDFDATKLFANVPFHELKNVMKSKKVCEKYEAVRKCKGGRGTPPHRRLLT